VIKYNGMKTKGKVHYILFSNEFDNVVEIPIAEAEAERIQIYIDKISMKDRKLVERGNDDPID